MARASALLAMLAGAALIACASAGPIEGATFVSALPVPGGTKDAQGLAETASGANSDRLGGISDIAFDYINNKLFLLSDRGAGAGVLSYETRWNAADVEISATSGEITAASTNETVFIVDERNVDFDGQSPSLLNEVGAGTALGMALDPEGLVVVPSKGVAYIADEYGPRVIETDLSGVRLRQFEIPINLRPKAEGVAEFGATGTPAVTTGRQDNRGFEGLAISPSGEKLFAILQDPLVEEGNATGLFSRNVRIVEYEVASGLPTAQYIYQLESIEEINARLGGADTFAEDEQGYNIGVGGLLALTNTQFLVIERDNRGLGVDSAINGTVDVPVGTKRVYLIDVSNATDVSAQIFSDNELPASVTPVTKELFLDIAAALEAAGEVVPEKIEGLTLGPQLEDGTFALIISTDNSYSVTIDEAGVQSDVYVSADGATVEQVPVNTTGPDGLELIPSFFYTFKTAPDALDFISTVVDFTANSTAVSVTSTAAGEWTPVTVELQRRGNLKEALTVQVVPLVNGTIEGAEAPAPGTVNSAPVTVEFAAGAATATAEIQLGAAAPDSEAGEVVLTLGELGENVYAGIIYPTTSLEVSYGAAADAPAADAPAADAPAARRLRKLL